MPGATSLGGASTGLFTGTGCDGIPGDTVTGLSQVIGVLIPPACTAFDALGSSQVSSARIVTDLVGGSNSLQCIP